MAIRIEHQPSGAAVGRAAYTAARNKARQRQQKNALDMWQEERREQRRYGNIYRNAIGGRRARQVGQQQQQVTGWKDPLQTALDADVSFGEEDTRSKNAVQIKAQRKTNARALRMGKPIPFPEAEMQPIYAPTEAEIDQKKWERGVEHEQDIHERNRAEKAEDATSAETLDIFKERYEGLREKIDSLAAEGPDAWATPKLKARFDTLQNALDIAEDQLLEKGDKKWTSLQVYETAAEEIKKFLAGHKDTHLVPPENRPGAERVTRDGRLIRKGMDGKDEDLGLAPWNMLTPEQREAREAERQSRFGTDLQGREGQYRRDQYGEYFDPFTQQKETPSWSERAGEIGKQRDAAEGAIGAALAATPAGKAAGYTSTPETWPAAQKAEIKKIQDRDLPYPGMDDSGQQPGQGQPGQGQIEDPAPDSQEPTIEEIIDQDWEERQEPGGPFNTPMLPDQSAASTLSDQILRDAEGDWPTVTSANDYEAVSPGAEYKDADGNVRQKQGGSAEPAQAPGGGNEPNKDNMSDSGYREKAQYYEDLMKTHDKSGDYDAYMDAVGKRDEVYFALAEASNQREYAKYGLSSLPDPLNTGKRRREAIETVRRLEGVAPRNMKKGDYKLMLQAQKDLSQIYAAEEAEATDSNVRRKPGLGG